MLAQSSTTIKFCGYKGYIFNANYDIYEPGNNTEKKFTPTKSDIILIEKLLKKTISKLNSARINQVGDCPQIDKNLRKYDRQYFGIIDDKGDRIIWINAIWSKDVKKIFPNIGQEYIGAYGGCSNHWNVRVNLKHQEVYDLRINGN